jgi:uncharacterized protein (TIGR03067 family)
MFVVAFATQGCSGVGSPEYQKLVGTWINEPPKKGRGTEHTFHFFKDGTVGWDRFQTMDGEGVAGTKKGYKVELKTDVSPKQITLSRGDGEEKEVRLGIYELDGDTLKLAIVGSKNRPKNFDDGFIALKRKAK